MYWVLPAAPRSLAGQHLASATPTTTQAAVTIIQQGPANRHSVFALGCCRPTHMARHHPVHPQHSAAHMHRARLAPLWIEVSNHKHTIKQPGAGTGMRHSHRRAQTSHSTTPCLTLSCHYKALHCRLKAAGVQAAWQHSGVSACMSQSVLPETTWGAPCAILNTGTTHCATARSPCQEDMCACACVCLPQHASIIMVPEVEAVVHAVVGACAVDLDQAALRGTCLLPQTHAVG